ncbi:DUF7220 family protein, partial [Ralstonia mannitolilytica]
FTAVSITRSYVLRRWFNRRAAAAIGESGHERS